MGCQTARRPATVEALASALRIPPVLANLLVQRGIDTKEKAHSFFNPQLSDLHDPFLMKDMDRAVERVEAAVRNQEKIMVYGDYDVDGTTAVALVYKVPAAHRPPQPALLHTGPLHRRVRYLRQGNRLRRPQG